MGNIKIVDSIMGKGKTTAAINYINQSDDDVRFLFITPYLKEVDRIIENCKGKSFVQPSNRKNSTKKKHLKQLLYEENNVVCTHSLFALVDENILNIIREKHYVLIMDEALDCIKDAHISPFDMQILTETCLEIDNIGFCKWKYDKYYGALESLKKYCNKKNLLYIGNTLVQSISPELFVFFDEILILTYMFEGQQLAAYFKLCNLDYEYYHLDGEIFTKGYRLDNGKMYKDKIHICDNFKMNIIGRKEKYDFKRTDRSLSKGWHIDNEEGINTVRKNCSNFFKNIHKARKGEYLWTTFKEYKDKVKGCGYSFGYIPLNTRATNDYGSRKYVAYLVNRFLNPFFKNGLIELGIKIDEEQYALSEMLQFIWRSAIRNGEDIYLYVPSVRMRILLKEWLGYENIEEDIERCRI